MLVKFGPIFFIKPDVCKALNSFIMENILFNTLNVSAIFIRPSSEQVVCVNISLKKTVKWKTLINIQKFWKK